MSESSLDAEPAQAKPDQEASPEGEDEAVPVASGLSRKSSKEEKAEARKAAKAKKAAKRKR
jgi:hypothetical protein